MSCTVPPDRPEEAAVPVAGLECHLELNLGAKDKRAESLGGLGAPWDLVPLGAVNPDKADLLAGGEALAGVGERGPNGWNLKSKLSSVFWKGKRAMAIRMARCFWVLAPTSRPSTSSRKSA